MPKPLFIVGTGRCGTTLLSAILNAHPDLHLSQESSFMMVTKRKRYAKSPKAELEWYFQSVPFGWLQLDKEDVLSKIRQGDSYSNCFRAILQVDAIERGKTAWGDKTPGHWMYVQAIRKDFPDAVIVHLVRDPREVVASMLKVPLGSPSFLVNSIYIRWALGCLRKEGGVHHLRLEDLLEQPEQVLRFILDQIELPWDDRLLHHGRYAVNHVRDIPWLVKARRPLEPYVAKRSLPPHQEAWVEWICRSSLMHFGYERYKAPLSLKALIGDVPLAFKSLFHLLRIICFPKACREKELKRWLSHNPKAFDRYPEWNADKVIQASFEMNDDS